MRAHVSAKELSSLHCPCTFHLHFISMSIAIVYVHRNVRITVIFKTLVPQFNWKACSFLVIFWPNNDEWPLTHWLKVSCTYCMHSLAQPHFMLIVICLILILDCSPQDWNKRVLTGVHVQLLCIVQRINILKHNFSWVLTNRFVIHKYISIWYLN